MDIIEKYKQFTFSNLDDWELELIKKYPSIYLEPNPAITRIYYSDNMPLPDNFCNLRFGFEFGKGWKTIVDDFSKEVVDLINFLKKGSQPDAYVKSFIFKQKFGTIRWQGDDNLNKIISPVFYKLVDDLQEKSSIVCETCGEDGMSKCFNGYVKTSCGNHN